MNYTPLIILAVIMCLVALFIVLYLPGYSRYQEMRAKETLLADEIARVQSENETLRAELELLRTNITHLERVMRDEMGLVKPGEVVYKVVTEPEPAPETAEPEPAAGQ